ncbi:MBL fold metallo-hydrolase [Martelella alba]|uniref:MBL fold metallo-hydrolase n=1 Tax=Martelella alba TaxID=2590451 RepID=A0A506UAX9_9HYPH|nr:MBL fold metallo-hydrolase [Martelella alba]TPW31523.1 MBL fold metallo-hydrolase [Martelella alba]
MTEPIFERSFAPRHEEPVAIADGIVRVTANNPSPFTFTGTNSYIIGDETVMVIDPGPEDEPHLEALLQAIGNRRVSHIAVTHTHRDHSPLAARLKAITGAPIAAEGGHRAARPLHQGETNAFAESADMALIPDILLKNGSRIGSGKYVLETVLTPGHTANHAAFALLGTPILFSGDHVMAWSTTVVAPPDGSMTDYMMSLEKLLARTESRYLPGHGGPVEDAASFVRGIRSHRRMRERAILARLEAGDGLIAEMVEVLYRSTDKALHGAAAMSVFAHLEALVETGAVVTDGKASITSHYRLAKRN